MVVGPWKGVAWIDPAQDTDKCECGVKNSWLAEERLAFQKKNLVPRSYDVETRQLRHRNGSTNKHACTVRGL
jgi:hypothetical protein